MSNRWSQISKQR